MLITHSSIVNSFIVVFNTSNGNVLSARKYSEGGFSNYNEAFNSMLLSPSHLHSAYVLSNYDFSSRLCTGQHLFKFDPVIFSNEPIWIKKTIGTESCGHLGLVFGRSESLIYAFSWHNGFSTVSLIDSNGNSIW